LFDDESFAGRNKHDELISKGRFFGLDDLFLLSSLLHFRDTSYEASKGFNACLVGV
jgi:hypothetical protein